MAQLAMEAKQRVHERRMRMEGKAALEKEQEEEKNEAEKKQAEEQEEIVKLHSRQFNMMKVGVPEGAILNSFSAEGIEEEEAKEIFEKLKAVKARRAEETRRREEAEKKQAEIVKKRNEEKEIIAKEKARLADQQFRGSKASKLKRMSSEGVSQGKVNFDKNKIARSRSTGASTHSIDSSSLARSASVGGSSITKSNSSVGGASKSSASTDASAAKAKMLSMIGNVSDDAIPRNMVHWTNQFLAGGIETSERTKTKSRTQQEAGHKQGSCLGKSSQWQQERQAP